METRTAIESHNLSFSYGTLPVLENVSFSVPEGSYTALIGANGAGKSTTLKTVSGMLHPQSGSIRFMDTDITHTESFRLVSRGMAHVPEGRRCFLQMTVQENLEMGAYTNPGYTKEGLAKVYGLFPRLKHRKSQVAGTLSGGEQQMLAMGRALMSQPQLLMLDEPSMGLAPILVQQIFDIVRELHRAGTTILLVEQNAEMALKIANRAYVLETGGIAMSGDAATLANDDSVRRAYLGG